MKYILTILCFIAIGSNATTPTPDIISQSEASSVSASAALAASNSESSSESTSSSDNHIVTSAEAINAAINHGGRGGYGYGGNGFGGSSDNFNQNNYESIYNAPMQHVLPSVGETCIGTTCKSKTVIGASAMYDDINGRGAALSIVIPWWGHSGKVKSAMSHEARKLELETRLLEIELQKQLAPPKPQIIEKIVYVDRPAQCKIAKKPVKKVAKKKAVKKVVKKAIVKSESCVK